jgi:hypothetical protein
MLICTNDAERRILPSARETASTLDIRRDGRAPDVDHAVVATLGLVAVIADVGGEMRELAVALETGRSLSSP